MSSAVFSVLIRFSNNDKYGPNPESFIKFIKHHYPEWETSYVYNNRDLPPYCLSIADNSEEPK